MVVRPPVALDTGALHPQQHVEGLHMLCSIPRPDPPFLRLRGEDIWRKGNQADQCGADSEHENRGG
jgi:hypothetical protein